jgi:hypothetical protein
VRGWNPDASFHPRLLFSASFCAPQEFQEEQREDQIKHSRNEGSE